MCGCCWDLIPEEAKGPFSCCGQCGFINVFDACMRRDLCLSPSTALTPRSMRFVLGSIAWSQAVSTGGGGLKSSSSSQIALSPSPKPKSEPSYKNTTEKKKRSRDTGAHADDMITYSRKKRKLDSSSLVVSSRRDQDSKSSAPVKNYFERHNTIHSNSKIVEETSSDESTRPADSKLKEKGDAMLCQTSLLKSFNLRDRNQVFAAHDLAVSDL